MENNSGEYPILASMARDALVVPASTVASESAFRTGRRVISGFRIRLTLDIAESLICLQDWFRTSSKNFRILVFRTSSKNFRIQDWLYNVSSLQVKLLLYHFFPM
uniref:Uncharacterized protein n=1 Tax=Avena sativa TaxID=4498 RepID=A0ACD5YDF4_AVESA